MRQGACRADADYFEEARKLFCGLDKNLMRFIVGKRYSHVNKIHTTPLGYNTNQAYLRSEVDALICAQMYFT